MINTLLNIIAPEYCLECGDEGEIWCDFCRLQHDPIPSRCFACHKQTSDHQTCKSCFKKTGLKSVYTCGEYKDFNKALIKSIKFDCKRHASISVAKSINDTLPYFNYKPVLVPVPSSPLRVRQRGFDHTLYITKNLAKISGLNYLKVLARTNDIRQVGAKGDKRKSQIKGAFRLKLSSQELPDYIILVDDVVTTGATLTEAAHVLKQAGVKRVDGAVFCYSV